MEIVPAVTRTDKRVASVFLNEHGVRFTSNEFEAFLVIRRQRLIAVQAFNNICGRICWTHMAGDGHWVTRESLRVVLGYPFRQLNLVAIHCAFPANNQYSLDLAKRFGFEEIHRVRSGWVDGVDAIYLEMLREKCRYLERRDIREQQAA